MRAAIVMLSLVAACSKPVVATPSSSAIDAWVVDAKGAVASADVRVVAVQPARCGCEPRPDDANYGDDIPECACPEALSAWRRQLAACSWPSPALSELRSDAKGHVTLGTSALGAMVEASTPTGVAWVAIPAQIDRIALELAKPVVGKLRVDTSAPLRAALLYDDGHCMPFRRAGDNEWATVGPVPELSEVHPTLVVEAAGYATVVRSWWFEVDDELALELHAATPVTGSCDGDTVTLDNAFQHLAAKVDAKHRFSITGVLDTGSTVTCTKRGSEVETWSYSPANGLEPDGVVFTGGFGNGGCNNVVLVDRAGLPIADAVVTFEHRPNAQFSRGAYTDKWGRACVEYVRAGGDLVVHPPATRGGWCAGETRLRITKWMLTQPIRVTLEVKPLPRMGWRGRLVSPENLPVASASISVPRIAPQNTGCNTSGDGWVTSALDGTFELPTTPHGDVELYIKHEWYAEQTVSLKVPSPERTFRLDRGITWTGRVLDAHGKNVDRCFLYLTLPSQHNLATTCSPTGFTFTTLVPGDVKVNVQATVDGKPQAPHEMKFTVPPGATMRQDITLP